MAEAAVSCLLEHVSKLLKYYADLIYGAESELEQLQKELAFLKAFLQDAPRKLIKKHLYKEMERQIKEIVYEVEDTIDACLTMVAEWRTRRGLLLRHLNLNRISLAKQVKYLREEKLIPLVNKAKHELSAIETGDAPGTSVEEEDWMNVKKAQLIRQEHVVGFQDEEETIISYLTEEKKELDVISIIGMPGLGKTTLAWKIFQNRDVLYEFPIRIWIHVSQRFSSRDVFLSILKKFKGPDMSSLSDQELVETVGACLEEGKFLLVLDDIWSVEDWKTIQTVLPQSNGMCKVLITSRVETVGRYASSTRGPHRLRFLTSDESWKLLQLEVFGNLNVFPQLLEDIGQQIANRCDGLPLAIVRIGGILRDQISKMRGLRMLRKEWQKVSENMSLFLQTSGKRSILDVVAESYNGLPDHLKECFLYMGVFPEHYQIPVWTLIRLWIAEGFVQPKGEKSLEETAVENLDDLISRNLVMADKINPMGEVKTCRVHDIIHAFCKSKACEKNLFREIAISHGEFEPPISEVGKFRRLSFHSDLKAFLSEEPEGPHVRSFLSFCKEHANLELRYSSVIPEAFNLLRVLESMSIKFNQFPRGITKLIHLRYVTLSIDALAVLPEAISRLWNLQTLVVDTTSASIKMKANIWMMMWLRHLKTKAAIVLDPEWRGRAGEELQTLTRLSPESCTETVSKKARYLKTLGICGKLAIDVIKTMSLEKFSHLEKLKLVNDSLSESSSENQPQGLPERNCFPPNLKRLTLSNTFLDWKHMSTLAKIDTLEVLKLKNYAFTGSSWDAVDDGFQSLQFLLIEEANLVQWDASTNHFPSLRFLVLKNCKNIKEIPECLGCNLEKLEIDYLPKSAVDSAMKIEAARKQELEKQEDKWGVRFKLSIGPGCMHSTIDQAEN